MLSQTLGLHAVFAVMAVLAFAVVAGLSVVTENALTAAEREALRS